MWEYQIKTEFVKDNKQLQEVLNEFGKDGWDIFSCAGYQKRGKKDKKGSYYYETEYTMYMKRCVEYNKLEQIAVINKKT